MKKLLSLTTIFAVIASCTTSSKTAKKDSFPVVRLEAKYDYKEFKSIITNKKAVQPKIDFMNKFVDEQIKKHGKENVRLATDNPYIANLIFNLGIKLAAAPMPEGFVNYNPDLFKQIYNKDKEGKYEIFRIANLGNPYKIDQEQLKASTATGFITTNDAFENEVDSIPLINITSFNYLDDMYAFYETFGLKLSSTPDVASKGIEDIKDSLIKIDKIKNSSKVKKPNVLFAYSIAKSDIFAKATRNSFFEKVANDYSLKSDFSSKENKLFTDATMISGVGEAATIEDMKNADVIFIAENNNSEFNPGQSNFWKQIETLETNNKITAELASSIKRKVVLIDTSSFISTETPFVVYKIISSVFDK